MQAAQRVAKNTGILYARMAVTVFISLYATRLVLDSLGVGDFGLFNVVGGVVAMLGFVNSSMAAATQRFMSFAQGATDVEKVKRIFNMSALLHAGIAVLMVVILEIVGYFVFNGILNIAPNRLEVAKMVYHFMVVNTFFTVLSVPYEAVITSHENMMFYAILGVLEAVLKLAIAVFLAHSTYDHLMAYGFLMAILSVFLLVLRRIYCHRYYAECVFNFQKYYDKVLLKEMTHFAGWNLLGSASGMISGYGSGIVLNHFHGTILNAANAIAGQVNGQLLVFSNTMQKALNPVIAVSEGKGNRELLIKATMSGSKMSFLLFAFFCIPFLLETSFILKFWLKNLPESTILFCQLAVIFTLIEQISVTLGTAISAVGQIKKINIYSSVVLVLNLLALLVVFQLGFPPYYMPVLAIVAALFITQIKLYYAKKFCGITYSLFCKEVVIPIVAVFSLSILVGLLPIVVMDSSFLRLMLVCILSSSCFIFLTFVFAFTESEKRIIQNLKVSILKKIIPRIQDEKAKN